MIHPATLKKLFSNLLLFISFISCNTKSTGGQDALYKALSVNNLQVQTFVVTAGRDTTIKGKSGTVLHIAKNTFVDNAGMSPGGSIDIELREAITPFDIATSGITTISNGKLLQAGGMIYINATSGGQQLQISNNKAIVVAVPNAKIKKGMKIFEGHADSGNINWINPQPLLTAPPAMQAVSDSAKLVKKGKSDDVADILEYVKSDTSKMPPQRTDMSPQVDTTGIAGSFSSVDNLVEKGRNTFREDYKTSYIFDLKKLGWANIDRLYNDPRTKQVEMITAIERQKEFNPVYITLIVSNQGMYIPGYQKKDGTFSFTHDDDEYTQLPVGENATILITVYKNDKLYYAIKQLTILEKQTFSIKLEETTDSKLKDELTKKL